MLVLFGYSAVGNGKQRSSSFSYQEMNRPKQVTS